MSRGAQLRPMKRLVVAVVDDDLRILGAMGRLLSALGYDVELYASASEFLEVAILTKATCCIIDIQIGESCGFDLVLHVAAHGLTIPTIFMSADRNESLKQRATNVGGIGFLNKPFSASMLIEALARLPRGRPSWD
jgi:FixJ family two-component response regulator